MTDVVDSGRLLEMDGTRMRDVWEVKGTCLRAIGEIVIAREDDPPSESIGGILLAKKPKVISGVVTSVGSRYPHGNVRVGCRVVFAGVRHGHRFSMADGRYRVLDPMKIVAVIPVDCRIDYEGDEWEPLSLVRAIDGVERLREVSAATFSQNP